VDGAPCVCVLIVGGQFGRVSFGKDAYPFFRPKVNKLAATAAQASGGTLRGAAPQLFLVKPRQQEAFLARAALSSRRL